MKRTNLFLPLSLMAYALICVPFFANAGVIAPTPIDGGLSLLIAAGVGYGIKKVRDEKKKHEEKM